MSSKHAEHERLKNIVISSIQQTEIRVSDRVLCISANKHGVWAMYSNIQSIENQLKFLENITKEIKQNLKKNNCN